MTYFAAYIPAQIQKLFRRFRASTAGALAPAIAILLPLVVGTVGASVDYSQAYLLRERMIRALDAATLAAATASDADIQSTFDNFFYKNFPSHKTGIIESIDLTYDADTLTAYGHVSFNTNFLRVLGYDNLDIYVNNEVKRLVQGIEVVLVLDNTGSMSYNNNIGTLKTAATNFINILFERTTDESYIKIGLVPYASTVNVGPYGLGEYHDGTYYDEPFVENPLSRDYNLGSNSQWHGCIKAQASPDDVSDNEGPWPMWRWCRNEDNDNLTCDYSYHWYYGYYANHNANYGCIDAEIVPLTSTKQTLLDEISIMDADGYTLGNFGMVWGGRVISPEYPYTEGVSWENDEWKKAIVLMTDGNNQIEGATFTAYGEYYNHGLDDEDLDGKLEDVCEDLLDKGLIIYTVTFDAGYNGISDETKDIYRNCASEPSKYHDAPSQDALIEVFEEISRELSNLHISS